MLVDMVKEYCATCDKKRLHETMTLLEIKITKCVVCGENK